MTIYTVTRTNWRRLPHGTFRLPGTVPVTEFDTFTEADTDRAAREATARRELNPFALGDHLSDVCSLPRYALADWLLENGYAPPDPDAANAEWVAWWANLEAADAERADTVFDRLWPMYTVEELQHPTVFARVDLLWAFPDEYYIAEVLECHAEGGEFVELRQERPADNRVLRDPTPAWWNEWRPPVVYDVCGWIRAEADLTTPVAFDRRTADDPRGIPADAVYQVPFRSDAGDPADAYKMLAVCRVGWASSPPRTDKDVRTWNQTGYRPVAAFHDRGMAEADAWARELVGRREVNPFRFGTPDQLSSLGSFRYGSMLRDLDVITPHRLTTSWYLPGWEQAALVEWYDAVAAHLTDSQLSQIWDLLDQLRLYEVREPAVRD